MGIGLARPTILVTAFNRPELLRSLLKIVQEQDLRLCLNVDGYEGKELSKETLDANQACRQIASENRNNFYKLWMEKENKGTGSVGSAIDKAFEYAESLIIIEEDILPSNDFFEFVTLCLTRFEEDSRIGTITGMNHVPEDHMSFPGKSLRLSQYFDAWGWATWKSRWRRYRQNQPYDIRNIVWPRTSRNFLIRKSWQERIQHAQLNPELGFWEYEFIPAFWTNKWMSIVPNRNLAINRGFGINATHTRLKPKWIKDNFENMTLEIIELPNSPDLKADSWTLKNVYNKSPKILMKTQLKSLVRNLSN